MMLTGRVMSLSRSLQFICHQEAAESHLFFLPRMKHGFENMVSFLLCLSLYNHKLQNFALYPIDIYGTRTSNLIDSNRD